MKRKDEELLSKRKKKKDKEHNNHAWSFKGVVLNRHATIIIL